MLKYLYSNNQNQLQIEKVLEQKMIIDNYVNKFYIRSSIIETKEILILDNNSNFFLINKKNIKKHLSLFKEKYLLGKALQLKEFVFSKKNYFKMSFYIKRQFYNTPTSYLKTLFLLKKNIKNYINTNWLLLIVNRSNFFFFFNGLKGFLPKKKFGKLKKIFKKLVSLKDKVNFMLKKQKKIIIKSLLLKNLKSNKLFMLKNKYKNQYNKLPSFQKTRKVFIKNIK